MITVVHPTRRPHLCLGVKETWLSLAKDRSRIQWIFGCDADDTETLRVTQGHERVINHSKRSLNKVTDMGCENALHDIMMFIGDDVECPQDWDQSIIDRMPMDRPAVLWVSDTINLTNVTHPIINRLRWEQQGKTFWCSKFTHTRVDLDFTHRAQADGVIVDAKDLVFRHNHKGAESDEVYRYSNFESLKNME